jgi:hypothetical protein
MYYARVKVNRKIVRRKLKKQGLKLHTEKTRLVPFTRPETIGPEGTGPDEPGTFDFLGFTHYWGKSRKGY